MVCGLEVARAVFAALEPALAFHAESADGQISHAGAILGSRAGGVVVNLDNKVSGLLQLDADAIGQKMRPLSRSPSAHGGIQIV